MSAPPKSPTDSSERVSSETVTEAVKSLFKWKDSKSRTQKAKPLAQDNDSLFLILTLKKNPPDGGNKNPFRIPLPHPFLGNKHCLIIDDSPKTNLSLEAATEKVHSETIPVSKVVTFSELKSGYKSFDDKRKLCDAYDLFFADKRIVAYLPKLLGNKFYKRKKFPFTVYLEQDNWKEQIERVCSSALFFINNGTCSMVRVGKGSMEIGDIVENVVEAINGVVEYVPGEWEGVRSFHLKFTESVALPVYQTVPSNTKLKVKGTDEDVKGVEAKDRKKKDVKLDKKKKGRIHEVKFMDSSDDESDAVVEDENESEKSDDDDLGGGGLSGKKRKNGGLVIKRAAKKITNAGQKGRGDLGDGNVGETSEDDDSGTHEVEVKKKAKKGDLSKGKRKNDLGKTVKKSSADKKSKKK